MPFKFAFHLGFKVRILDKFKDYLEITELLPIHMKDTFDFSDTDLI